jgi:hypothetical protein
MWVGVRAVVRDDAIPGDWIWPNSARQARQAVKKEN